MNQAALKAAVDGKDMVTMKELEFSKDKILMGRQSFSSRIKVIILNVLIPSGFELEYF